MFKHNVYIFFLVMINLAWFAPNNKDYYYYNIIAKIGHRPQILLIG